MPGNQEQSLLSPRILVVDDDHDCADSLTMFLKLLGFEALAVYDGVKALEMAEALRPEVVILDIGLPHTDGYKVARQLRALPATQNALLIAATGHGEAEYRVASFKAGISHHLLKPLDPEVLHERIAAHLAQCS